MYKLVRSASNNLDSVADAEANGTLVMDWTADTMTYVATGLNSTSPYYFTVLVKNTSGGITLYTQKTTTTAAPECTRESGSNSTDQWGTFSLLGVASSSNVPRARCDVVTWTYANGNLWLFGGYDSDSAGNRGALNDLWRYAP